MATTRTKAPGGAASVTPVVLQNDTKAPYYGEKYSETASRTFYTRYVEYKKRVAHANTGGAVQRELAPMAQLIPNHVQRVFARVFKHTHPISPENLVAAVKKHAGHEAGADVDLSAASAAVAKAVIMDRKGKTMLERVEPILSGLEYFFAENPNFEAVYRSPDGSYIRGPAEIITKALVDGLAPDKFKSDVMVKLRHKGSWKNDPDLVMDTVVDAAKEWRKIESLEGPPVSSKDTPRQQGARSAGQSEVVCHGCGQRGHIKTNCPASSGAAQGQSGDSTRQQRRPRKGRGRGGRGAGGGGSTGGGNSSQSASSQSGTSGSGSGAAAPQRAVQVDSASAGSTAVSAPVVAPVPPPGAAPGAMSAVEPAMSGFSPWTPGWSSYPPAVPFDPVGTSQPAQPARPWRHVGFAAPRSADEVPVEFADKYVPAELCLPGHRERGAIAVRAVLDSGAHFTSLSLPIVEMLERMIPGVQMRIPFSLGARQAVTASGQKVAVTERTIPLQLALVTAWGPAPLPPISFAIMPGSDGVILLGLPTLQDLRVDPYACLSQSLKPPAFQPASGVETPAYLGNRRVSLSVEAFQEVGGQVAEERDEAVERLVERGPEMFMEPAEEESARKVALEEGVTDAVAAGLSVSNAERLRGILHRRVNAFRRALRGDSPARVEPMRVPLKPGASAVKAAPRRYTPVKSTWLAACMTALLAFGLVVRNLQAVWASPAMAVPKKDSFRLVSDYKAVNEQVEKSPGVMPNQESDMTDLLSARFFGKLDLLQGYWQMPLAEEAREIFTITTPEGLFTPTRVPQGVLNATAYFQGVMTELLAGLKCKIWVDDVFFFADTEDELLDTLDAILARLESVGLFAAAHKCTFFARELVWCGKVYSQGCVSHDPVRVQGLSDMRRPETAAELMQFLQATNWLRTSLPRMAEVVAPLRLFLEEMMAGAKRRTKRVAKNRAIPSESWTPSRLQAWAAAQALVAHAVTLYHPRPGCQVLMFPDASECHWGSFVTQVPDAEMNSLVPVEDMSHEPLAFLSGSFKGSQMRWATIDKEGFAIVSTFRRLEHLLWDGVHIFTDHRNLAYIFNPDACVSSVSKALAQRLEGWKGVLGQYRYTIRHIPGDRNAWGDLLSRWVNVPAMPVRAVAVFAPCDPDDSMPSKDVVRQAQRKARAADGADVPAFDAVVGRAVLDDEGLFRVLVRGRNVLWIPDSDQQLQVRLMICAHMRDAGHRGVAATLVRLQEFCVWSGMESHVRDFVGQCLHCADTRSGDVVPRPLGETVHGTAPNEVVHFDYLYVGQSGPLASQGLSEAGGFRYILVIMDDLSNYVCLEPVEVCTAESTAAALLNWCKTLGVPRVWVSDTATHFKNAIMIRLREALSVEHQFAVAYSPWSNGTCERMVKEVIRALRSILLEQRREVSEWVDVLPAVQWALNTAFRRRYGSTPYHVMFGRAPRTSFSVLASSSAGEWNCDVLDDAQIKRALQSVIELQERFLVQVQERVAAERARRREGSSSGLELPNFEVGDYVLYARVRRPGVTPKLMATWTGPWRVVGAHHPHVFEIQNIVTGRVQTAHVARLRFYADSQLNVTADVKNVFQHAYNQGQFQMAGVVRVAEAEDRSLIVLVDWVGFEVEERTWEPLKDIFEAAPEFLAKELRKLRVTRAVAARITREFGIPL